MVEKIEINFNNNLIIFDVTNKFCMYNSRKCLFDMDKVNEIIYIISSWNKSYINNSVLDGNYYEIKIYSNNNIDKYILKNKYPFNFDLFLNIIGDIYE